MEKARIRIYLRNIRGVADEALKMDGEEISRYFSDGKPAGPLRALHVKRTHQHPDVGKQDSDIGRRRLSPEPLSHEGI
jgi:hypothetical protein